MTTSRTSPATGGHHVARRPEARGISGRLTVRSCGHADTGSTDTGSTDTGSTDTSTTDTGTTTAAAVVAQVRELHRELARRTTLAPSPGSDALFGRLVALATDPVSARDADAVLADPAVAALLPDLRRLCADGEFELERSWTRRIVGNADPRAELARFPYCGNYRDLTRLEHHTVSGVADAPVRRVLFVGSGPLPLTSLLLAQEYGCRVDNVDIDPDAAALGAGLTAALGTPGLTFRVGDVEDDAEIDGYDLVYLAALAGLEPDAKLRLLAHLGRCLRPGTLVLARSAHALRALLYPVLDPESLPGLDALAVVHPYTDVVNSVVVARVRG
ncbi:nicotianamine synthase family protein [Actinomycetospora atypica]|uniref:Nicotianamine synthase family protein n=1 Tax=Actinomycetospora atypica TaxID=1290095 RepID=A0ABV9YJ18_9PSEU